MNTIHAMTGFPHRGTYLPNTARVLDSVITSQDQEEEGVFIYGYVLAQRDNGEFATWRMGMAPNGDIQTWAGHYYDNIVGAVQNFRDRLQGA